MQATDPDSGDNGLLLYSLVNHQTNEFDIDENTGQIFTVSVAGKVGTFYLEVQAADQGGKGLTARTNVNVIVDSSSSRNIVVLVLNQKINVVEKSINEVERVIEDILAWNIYIVDVYSNEFQSRTTESTDVTYMKIIAVDEANEEIPAEDVKRKLREQKANIEKELEKIFSTTVTAAVEEPSADSTSPELVATIVLSVLLACTLIAFLVYVVISIKRKRMYDQQYLLKKLHEVEGIDNPNLADKNGSLNSLVKPEDTKEVKTETIAFSNLQDTKEGNADKDALQADEKCNYLETLLLDISSEQEKKVASENAAPPRNDASEHDSAPSLTPAPDKGIKGVKFSEAAIILDTESELNDSDEDSFPQ
ncbi:uncharacterized protein LOC116487090 [Aythya fuligula]|uniref:Uncharacterized protein LOC116487090 n=1 Tax=Aythya fuligula TaxID=219594 RepID=A0A6J3CND7_AYTFU|nr:uncharacterized protein LOC116487090 [Aythya fuligula]